jgi:DNA-binding NarL/FixJ family response regulator
MAGRHRPDVVILDIGMPGMNGLEAARMIRKVSPDSEVLILTMHESEQIVREVLRAGARGYVLKSDAGRDLVRAVELLGRHKPFITTQVGETVLQKLVDRRNGAERPSTLSDREREVVQLLAEGYGNKEVADALGISIRTAETHRANIMRKLDCHAFSDLIRYAIRNNIVTP